MTLPPDFKLTSEMLWQGALLFAIMDLVLAPLLASLIKPIRFRQIIWMLVIVTAIFWALLWAWVLDWGWNPVYSYVFPDWLRVWLPLLQGLHFAIVSLVFWWGALRYSNPVVAFCLLGGMWGLVTHLWALYMGLVTKPPMMQGASPVAAVVIAIFEFMFYWCIILSIALLLWHGWQWVRRLMHMEDPVA
jgi:hypothetical protein